MPVAQSRILSAAQLDEMAELRESGWDPGRIARYFTRQGTPISKSAINWQCLKFGADAPVRLRRTCRQPSAPYQRGGHIVRPYTPADDALLRAMAVQNFSKTIIANRLGRGVNSIIGRLLTLARHDARAEEEAA